MSNLVIYFILKLNWYKIYKLKVLISIFIIYFLFLRLLDKYTELKGKVDLNDVTLDVYNCLCKFHKTQPSHVPIKYLLNNFYNFYRVKKEITFGIIDFVLL